MNICLIDVPLPQLLINGLVKTLIFEVVNLHISFGTLGAHVRDGCWHLRVGECIQCLGHDVWLTVISVGCPNVPFHILHRPGELV